MRRALPACLLLLTLGLFSCVNVKAPERIDIGGGPRGEDIDSSRVPDPQSLDEARAELRKAYRQIQYLEHKVQKLEDDKRELKDERDEYKRKYKRATGDD